MAEWVVEVSFDRVWAANLEGVAWHQAPVPGRWHRCQPGGNCVRPNDHPDPNGSRRTRTARPEHPTRTPSSEAGL